MAFLNIFKKKPFDSAAKGGLAQGKEEARQAVKNEIVRETPKRTTGVSSLSLPHISEKAAVLGTQNQYVFKVMPRATKYGVKASIEEQYGVLVKKVAMIRVPAKSIRVGKTIGEKQGYKKAVVKLKEGHKIETVSS